MSEQVLAFGLLGLFLFFTALAVSGLQVGTCPQCDHCRDVRRREEEQRQIVRAALDERYRLRSLHRPDDLARRQALLRDRRERSSPSSHRRDH